MPCASSGSGQWLWGCYGGQTTPEPTFNIHFGGGPIEGLIEKVSKARGSLLNVANPEVLTRVPIPAIRMHQVNAPTLSVAVSMARLKKVGVVQNH